MADRIVVMRDGRILQVGTPSEIYERPADVFTARFIGSPTMNMLPATLTEGGIEMAGVSAPVRTAATDKRGSIHVGIRPHDLVTSEGVGSGGLVLSGVVNAVEPLGPESLIHVAVRDAELVATAPGKSVTNVGQTVTISAAIGSLYMFDATTDRFIGRA